MSYVPMAVTADRWTRGRAATVVANAFATRVHAANGVASGVTWRDTRTGAAVDETARVVVLAAGAIETPRLFLNSGLPNPNDWVGRGLTDHYLDVLVGRLRTYVGTSRGPASGARADFPGYGSIEGAGVGPGLLGQALTTSDSGIVGYYNSGVPDAGRLVGERLKRFVADIDRVMLVAVLTDDEVMPQNRVAQSQSLAADMHGPVARIELRARSPRTRANREYLAQRAAEILRAAGAREIARMNWAPVLIHIHSSMRMGLSESDSVLDGDGETRAVKRLFVADASALPNALGGPNPTLTMQALATRTAEKIFTRYFGGDPWVVRESPVSSIDDTVTQAALAAGL